MRILVSLFGVVPLATAAAPCCQARAAPGAVVRDPVQTARVQLAELQRVVDYHKVKTGASPESWTPLITKDAKGFRVLEADGAPRDPWGHEYRLARAQDRRTVVVSAGPDGKFGTEDDLDAQRSAVWLDPVRSLGGLHDLTGEAFDRTIVRDRIVVLYFWSMKCPHVWEVEAKLKELAAEFEREVAVLAIAVNSDEVGEPPPAAAFRLPDPAQRPYALLREHVQRERLGHPVLVDHSGDTARVFGATRTTHCLVLDGRARVGVDGLGREVLVGGGVRVVYSGAFDRAGPQDDRTPRPCFVRDAIEALLRGERPARAKGPAPQGTPLRPHGTATPGK